MDVQNSRTWFPSGVENCSQVCFVRSLVRAEAGIPIDAENRSLRFGRKRYFLFSQCSGGRQNQQPQIFLDGFFIEGFTLVKPFAPVIPRELNQEAQGFSRETSKFRGACWHELASRE